jgi:hypothetical protein
VTLVRELVRERGYAKEKTIRKFLTAGYKKEQVMELLLGIALKTISNYLEHISPTPFDHRVAGELPTKSRRTLTLVGNEMSLCPNRKRIGLFRIQSRAALPFSAEVARRAALA